MQQNNSLFTQSQLFLADQDQPISIIDILSPKQQKLSYEEHLIEKNQCKSDMKSLCTDLLIQQLIESQIISPDRQHNSNQNLSSRIKKLNFILNNASPKNIPNHLQQIDIATQSNTNQNTLKILKKQEQLFNQTASQSHRKSIEKIISTYQLSQNNSLQTQPIRKYEKVKLNRLPMIQ